MNLKVNSASKLLGLCLVLITMYFFACKQENEPESEPGAGGKTSAKVSAQPLPGGKANFSVAIGRFANSGTVFVRMVNWTFNASAGTVGATFWHWDSSQEKGKAAYNSHVCTYDGITRTCETWTPSGWVVPSGQYTSWTGTYTYNSSTGALAITWSSGHGENWTITNPQTGLARAVFVSSSGYGYNITHGHGYGSNASWSTFKAIADIPRVSYRGWEVIARMNAAGTRSITPTDGVSWKSSGGIDLSTYTYPSSPTPKNSMHRWVQPASGIDSVCGTGATNRKGIVYHLSSKNTNRSMIWGHFCATLAPNTMFPCYTGASHPYAFQQIIDDSGAIKGFIGIEQQDEPGSAGFQYQIKDYTTVPW